MPGMFFSCAKEEFAATRGQKQETVPQVVRASANVCANFTLIRPKVDILFLSDNSTSSVFINEQTKESLNQLVKNVSDRFDYHIVIAPLIRSSGNINEQLKFASFDDQGIAPSILGLRFPKEDAYDELRDINNVGGNIEAGLDRAQEIIAGNITNGLFRQGAHTLIVLLSTENQNFYPGHDNGGNFTNIQALRRHVDDKIHELLCLRGNYGGFYGTGYTGPYGVDCSNTPNTLNSTMMRFISVVAHQPSLCSQNAIFNSKVGEYYMQASDRIYREQYTNGTPRPTDDFSNTKDSTDICIRDYDSIFDGVNSAIQDTVVAHTYKYWPVDQASRSVDPSTIKVRKGTGQEFFAIPNNVTIIEDAMGTNDTDALGNPVNGWRYMGNPNVNPPPPPTPTRFLPTVGEPYFGHLIQLFGQAKVTYPECLQVTYDSQIKYIGYVHIPGKPLASSIELRVNGSLVTRCQNSTSTNCWELEMQSGQPHYQVDKNIMIQGPGNFTPASPADLRTGYFLRLRGNAVIPSGASINVNWLPSS
jgi:hypothetical protein